MKQSFCERTEAFRGKLAKRCLDQFPPPLPPLSASDIERLRNGSLVESRMDAKIDINDVSKRAVSNMYSRDNIDLASFHRFRASPNNRDVAVREDGQSFEEFLHGTCQTIKNPRKCQH